MVVESQDAGREELVERRNVQASRAGDRASFGALVERYTPGAMAAAMAITAHREDAADVVQEAMVTAFCCLGQLRDDTLFGPWLRTIVRQAALTLLRRRGRERVTTGDALPEVCRQAAPAEGREGVVAAVEALPPELREPVVLYYFEGWACRRIARFLGLSEAAVKGRLHQARGRLAVELSPQPPRRNDMATKRVKKQVGKSIHQIATEPIHREVPLAGARQVVVFCGLPTDIELCHTEGDAVVLNGTRASFGPTARQARASMGGIELLSDRVDDYLASGPHAGEVFYGTHKDEAGYPRPYTKTSGELWGQVLRSQFDAVASPGGGGKSARAGRLRGEEAARYFGELVQPVPGASEQMRRHAKDVLRLSVVRSKVEDVVLPIKLVTPDIARLIQINNANTQRVHGQVGRMSLTIAVPAGCGVMVVGLGMGGSVHAQDLQSDLVLIEPWQATLSRVDGDVLVLDGLVVEATDISGRFMQTHHALGSGFQNDYRYDREVDQIGGAGRRQTIRGVRGGVHIDCLKLDLDCADLGGQVHIRNVLGSTRLVKRAHAEGDRAELLTESGSVEVMLDETLVGRINISAVSMAGAMEFPALGPLGKFTHRCNLMLMGISTIEKSGGDILPPGGREAEVFAQCREGRIRIDRLPAVTPEQR